MRAMGSEIALDRYAQIRAEMEAGVRRDDVLARAGLSDEEWAAAQRTWLEEMGRELSLGRFDLTNRYTQAFVERQRALITPMAVVPVTPTAAPVRPPAASPPSIEAVPSYLSPGAAPVPPAPSSMPPARVANPLLAGTMMAIDGAALRAALPFNAQARMAPPAPPAPPPKPAPAALSGTAIGHVMPKVAAPSVAPGAAPASPALPAPAALPAVRRAPAALSGTSMAVIAPKRPALPFGAGSSGAEPPSGPPTVGPDGADDSVATLPIPPSVVAAATAAARAAMPFQPGHGPQRGAASATVHQVVAPAAAAVGSMTGEIPADVIARLAKAMPFGPTSSPTAAPQRPPAPPGPPVPAMGGTDETATVALPPFVEVRPATPFPATAPPAPSPGAPPTLTLEQYAALCAELAAFPQQQDAVFQRYGLGAQRDRAVVDAAWQQRLRSNAAEYQRWQALYQQHQRHVLGAVRRDP
jgi:hypothetical protein